MKLPMSKRARIRLILFLSVAIVLLLIKNIILMRESADADLFYESTYLRAVEDLSQSAENITNTLSKELCAGSSQMQSKLSAKLLSDAATAKASLSQLPISELSLSNTNKFLSQVGNYAVYLSEKSADGEELTEEEYQNLSLLYEYSARLSENMWTIEQMLSAGKISPQEVILSLQQADLSNSDVPSITDGFLEFEEGFEDYPTLIYDGPFSDHLLNSIPKLLINQEEISEGGAKAIAARSLGVTVDALKRLPDEEGNMPSYYFSSKDASVCITKRGGLIAYMLKSRNPSSSDITPRDAIAQADKYLSRLEIENMAVTYYETLGNVCTINYAYSQDGVIIYSDLIKIKVALDNGEVLGFDARGFISSHHERKLSSPKLTKVQAKKNVSSHLTIENTRLAIIPLKDTTEGYCYEFKCKNSDGRHVLVYIDCMTGKELEILMLYESEGGVLAM